ncbi:MAG: DUF2807 domain-containing protein [Pseudomonadota bacterium]|nr:DUF2807 domain-containing protein [Pseudomonadota bacterium]
MRMAIVAAALALGACSAHGQEGGDERAQRDFQVGTFDRVALAGSPDVIVTVGGPPSVRAEGDAEAVEELEVRVEGGELRIGRRGHGGWSWSSRKGGVTIHVSAPALTAAAVTGSGNMRVDRVEGQSFSAAVTGSGNLTLGAVRVQQASFVLTGSGNVRAAGSAAQAQVSVTGSGNAHLDGLDTQSADLRVRGSGNASLRATQTASVSLRGSGNVGISGGARCSIDKRGSGDVRCG